MSCEGACSPDFRSELSHNGLVAGDLHSRIVLYQEDAGLDLTFWYRCPMQRVLVR